MTSVKALVQGFSRLTRRVAVIAAVAGAALTAGGATAAAKADTHSFGPARSAETLTGGDNTNDWPWLGKPTPPC